MDNQQIVKPAAPGTGTITVKQEGLGESVAVSHEKSIAAAAAAATATIEARVIAAQKWPRNVDAFRLSLLKTCQRPGFADIALFRKPVGGKEIVDFSIRFVEAAIQQYGHMHVMDDVEYEDGAQAKIRVTVFDAQHNSSMSSAAIVEKLVERRSVAKGRTVRGMRQNIHGDTVYLVEATADEFRNQVGTERSKLIRDLGKRLLPRDILDECREMVDRTQADENAKDPDAAKKKVLDRFATVGVTPAMLTEYLGHPLDGLTLKDLNDLAGVYNGLKEGSVSWADVMRSREPEAPPDAPPPTVRTRARDKIMQTEPGPEPDKK